MNLGSTHSFAASLVYHLVASDDFSSLTCRGCGWPLELHQPDPNQFDRFVATCPECGRWYWVAPAVEEGMLTVLELPEVVETDPPPLPSRDGQA